MSRNNNRKPSSSLSGDFVVIGVLMTVCLFLSIFLPVFSEASAGPFKIPEKFVYDLSWTGIKAGTASLELVDDGNTFRIISTARSAEWISVFFTVEDRVESTLTRNSFSQEFGLPLKYKLRIREGRHRRNKEVFFDRDHNKARYVDYLKNEKKEFDVPGSVLDPISSFYYLRLMKLVVGESVYLTVFDSKRVWNVEVKVLRKERLTLPAGTFDTVVVKPLMKSEGIFYRKGEIVIWLTDDAKHVPVKMQTKVPVGSVIATLVRASY